MSHDDEHDDAPRGRAFEWFPRLCNLTAEYELEILADEYGAEGVLAVEEIVALARLSDDGGYAEVRYAQLAKRACLKTPRRAWEIACAARELALFSLVPVTVPRGFYALVTPAVWDRLNDQRKTGGERKKRERAKARLASRWCHNGVTDLSLAFPSGVTGLSASGPPQKQEHLQGKTKTLLAPTVDDAEIGGTR